GLAIRANIAADRWVRTDVSHVDRAGEQSFDRCRSRIERFPFNFGPRAQCFLERAICLADHGLRVRDIWERPYSDGDLRLRIPSCQDQHAADREHHKLENSPHDQCWLPPDTTMGSTAAGCFCFFLRLRLSFPVGRGSFTMSASVVFSRILAAASRTSRDAWESAPWAWSLSMRLRSCSASPNGGSGPSIRRMISLR